MAASVTASGHRSSWAWAAEYRIACSTSACAWLQLVSRRGRSCGARSGSPRSQPLSLCGLTPPGWSRSSLVDATVRCYFFVVLPICRRKSATRVASQAHSQHVYKVREKREKVYVASWYVTSNHSVLCGLCVGTFQRIKHRAIRAHGSCTTVNATKVTTLQARFATPQTRHCILETSCQLRRALRRVTRHAALHLSRRYSSATDGQPAATRSTLHSTLHRDAHQKTQTGRNA